MQPDGEMAGRFGERGRIFDDERVTVKAPR